MEFPVSGVEVNPLVPLLAAFVISAFTAPAGISGAFLLLPFQVSFLGFAGPAVSPTNLVYNILSTPGGIYRYIREGRMEWGLAWAVVLGTLPGVFVGALLRIGPFSDPRAFKFFVGLVLLYLGLRMAYDLAGGFFGGTATGGWKEGDKLSFNPVAVVGLSLAVGIVGGIYGVGGAAIIAPFFVAIMRLPVHLVAGATLMGTFATSVAGVAFFQMLGAAGAGEGPVSPDWALGAVLGIGGLAGSYTGARLQRFVPATVLKVGITAAILYLAADYLITG